MVDTFLFFGFIIAVFLLFLNFFMTGRGIASDDQLDRFSFIGGLLLTVFTGIASVFVWEYFRYLEVWKVFY